MDTHLKRRRDLTGRREKMLAIKWGGIRSDIVAVDVVLGQDNAPNPHFVSFLPAGFTRGFLFGKCLLSEYFSKLFSIL